MVDSAVRLWFVDGSGTGKSFELREGEGSDSDSGGSTCGLGTTTSSVDSKPHITHGLAELFSERAHLLEETVASLARGRAPLLQQQDGFTRAQLDTILRSYMDEADETMCRFVIAVLWTVLPNFRESYSGMLKSYEASQSKKEEHSKKYGAPALSEREASNVTLLRTDSLYMQLTDPSWTDESSHIDEYYWTRQYSRLRENSEDPDALVELSNLTKSFTHAATMYARVIVAEYATPYKHKSIKPASLGGIAGGEKFICAGMFFKFATDVHGIYGSDLAAAKAARADLIGLDILSTYGKDYRIRVPLACVVDCHGMSMLALSRLPVAGDTTLVYGSADGGKTIRDEVPDVTSAVTNIGAYLNLKPHRVGDKTMHLCGDAEVHRSLDEENVYYLLDVARLMPCEPPVENTKQAIGECMSKLLRPELVMVNSVPLCSDAFSAWDDSPAEEAAQSRNDVSACAAQLLEEVVPRIATTIDMHDSDIPLGISDMMHSYGCNVRFMKCVYSRLSSQFWRRRALSDMAARAAKILAKSIMNKHLRKLKGLSLSHSYVCLVQSFLRDIFVSKKVGTWAEVYEELNAKFIRGDGLDCRSGDELRAMVDQQYMFTQVCTMIGVSFAQGNLSDDIANAIMDIESIGTVTHDMSFTEIARVSGALKAARMENDEARKVSFLKELQIASKWGAKELAVFKGAIPNEMMELANMLAMSRTQPSLCRRMFYDAIRLFHVENGYEARKDNKDVWVEWLQKEVVVGHRIKTFFFIIEGHGPQSSTWRLRNFLIEREAKMAPILPKREEAKNEIHSQAMEAMSMAHRLISEKDWTGFASEIETWVWDYFVTCDHLPSAAVCLLTYCFLHTNGGCAPLTSEQRDIMFNKIMDIEAAYAMNPNAFSIPDNIVGPRGHSLLPLGLFNEYGDLRLARKLVKDITEKFMRTFLGDHVNAQMLRTQGFLQFVSGQLITASRIGCSLSFNTYMPLLRIHGSIEQHPMIMRMGLPSGLFLQFLTEGSLSDDDLEFLRDIVVGPAHHKTFQGEALLNLGFVECICGNLNGLKKVLSILDEHALQGRYIMYRDSEVLALQAEADYMAVSVDDYGSMAGVCVKYTNALRNSIQAGLAPGTMRIHILRLRFLTKVATFPGALEACALALGLIEPHAVLEKATSELKGALRDWSCTEVLSESILVRWGWSAVVAARKLLQDPKSF